MENGELQVLLERYIASLLQFSIIHSQFSIPLVALVISLLPGGPLRDSI